jgi:two-component system, chemotaxis family, chemotaxis protein CheY
MAKFLIVDDSPLERFTVRKCLEKLNHEVVAEAKNGTEALEFYKNTMPDIVMLDIMMPDENGIDILKHLIEYDKSAKVIMCTSSAARVFVLNATKLGAKHFIAKPITINSLASVVEATLKH